jgi:hypothetical protein
MSLTPKDILRIYADLRDRLAMPEFGTIIEAHLREDHGDRFSGDVGSTLHESVKAAQVYHVDNDTMENLRQFADKLPDNIEIGLPPTYHGFVVFDEPLVFQDVRGLDQKIHVITWSAIRAQAAIPMVLVTMWNDTERDLDDGHPYMMDPALIDNPVIVQAQRAMGRWSMIHGTALYALWNVGPKMSVVDAGKRAEIIAQGSNPVEETWNFVRFLSIMFNTLPERD